MPPRKTARRRRRWTPPNRALAAAEQQLAGRARPISSTTPRLSDYATITAPYDGVVTWRFSDTGALVQAGTSSTSGLPVVTVAQVDVLRLRIPVPESLAGKVRIGDSADVHVQATGEHFTGKVTRFTDALDPSTRTMQVEIDVPNPKYELQPGMYADVTLQANSRAEGAHDSDHRHPALATARPRCWWWIPTIACRRAKCRWASRVRTGLRSWAAYAKARR